MIRIASFLAARRAFIALAAAMVLTACQQSDPPQEAARTDADSAVEAQSSRSLVVYTSRQPHLVDPLFEEFTEQTGIEIDYISDSEAALIERLDAEGRNTPASVLITVDAGNLWHAAERDLLQSLDSELLQSRIPSALRDPDGEWFGVSIRARTIVYHPDRVDASALTTYADLAEAKWKERLCLRTSSKVYNQSLVAMMIERLGEDVVEDIVSGWVDNLATEPFSSDTRLVEAMAAGQCDVGIVNSYYLGRLQRDDSDYPVQLFWANQDSGGVHVNISGAGVTRHAPDRDLAVELIEWMLGDPAQQMIAAGNLEFPVVEGIALDPIVERWGDYQADTINLRVAGERQAQAVRLMDRAGWR